MAGIYPNESGGSVAASTDVVVLAVANSGRSLFSIFNNCATGYLYVDIDNDPSLTNAWLAIPPMATYVSDFTSDGEIRGIWDVADGQANIREFN